MLFQFLQKRKYEFLLVALLLHLFVAIFVSNLFFYSAVLWPINIILLGVAGFVTFVGKNKWKDILRIVIFLPVMILTLAAHEMRHNSTYFLLISIVYVVFFILILGEVMKFLIKPGYINADIISASACGYLLLIEIATFLFQYLFYKNPASLKGIDAKFHATTYNDLVYFSSITVTSIGFGDITPATYYTKLLTALLGIAGHFYSVVVIGIVISKFASRKENE